MTHSGDEDPSAGQEGGIKDSCLPPAERVRRLDLALVLVAILPLFLNLGQAPLWGPEGRWLDISSGMLASGDWLEPERHGEFYGDKPLLSYWTIAIDAELVGHLDEKVGRMPSAIAGAFTILCTAWMAWRLLGRRAVVLAAWILATTYTFFLWSRTASADALNLAMTTAAVAVYVAWVRRSSPWKILLFFALLSLGGHVKGMPAIIVPLGVAGADVVLSRRTLLLRQAGWVVLGTLLGAALYLAPFMLSYYHRGDWRLLELMWKENFVRAFDAFDHRAPVYYYVYILPAMLLPWSLWLPGGLAWAGKSWKAHREERFALLAFAVIFLLFTASESRRSYYILPAFPFSSLIVTGFLVDVSERRSSGRIVGKLWIFLVSFPMCAIGSLVGLGAVFFLGGFLLPGSLGKLWETMPYCIPMGLALVVCAWLLAGAWKRRDVERGLRAVALSCLVLAVYFSTGVESVRERDLTERAFAAEVKRAFPGSELYCYRGINERLTYYLGTGKRVKSPEEIVHLLEGGRSEVLLVCDNDRLPRLRECRELAVTELLKVSSSPAVEPFFKKEARYFLLKCTHL